jgi:hypothetical protein
MRLLSLLCGLSFAVMAGYLFAVSLIASLADLPPQYLGDGIVQIPWATLVLALLGAGLALHSRCEGWTSILAGCGLFMACQLVAMRLAGPGVSALMCLAAAGFVLWPLMRTPSSYWRVAG